MLTRTISALVPVFLCGAAAAAAAVPPFTVEELSPGIHLFRPTVPNAGRANSLVVEQDGGLVVVDSQPSPNAAREFLVALHALGKGAIRFLVLSHPHADSAGGASAFPPEVSVIASGGTAESLADPTYDFGAEERARAVDPSAWVEPPRARIAIAVSGPLELADSRNPVRLGPLPPAHSPGDMLIEIPNAGILHLGGVLSSERNPWARGSRFQGWLGSLNHVSSLNPRLVVGVRGPASGVDAIRAQRDAFAWVRGQVDFAFIEQVAPEKIANRVLEAESIGRYFDMDARPSFAIQLIEQAMAEAIEHRKKRGAL